METEVNRRLGIRIPKKYRNAVAGFVERVLGKYGGKVESIILFGSVARGEAREDSDVDILVVLKEGNIADMRDIYGMAFDVLVEHSLDISLKVYSLSEVLKRVEIGAPFIEEVLKDGVSLYGEIKIGGITA